MSEITETTIKNSRITLGSFWKCMSSGKVEKVVIIKETNSGMFIVKTVDDEGKYKNFNASFFVRNFQNVIN